MVIQIQSALYFQNLGSEVDEHSFWVVEPKQRGRTGRENGGDNEFFLTPISLNEGRELFN